MRCASAAVIPTATTPMMTSTVRISRLPRVFMGSPWQPTSPSRRLAHFLRGRLSTCARRLAPGSYNGCWGQSLRRSRRCSDKARLVIVCAAGAILLAFLAAHASPVRALVLRRVVEACAVRTPRTSARGIVLVQPPDALRRAPRRPASSRGYAGRTIRRRRVARSLVRSALADWRRQRARLSIASPRLDIRRHADGTDNLPRVATAIEQRSSLTLPPIRVDDLDVSFQQPSVSAATARCGIRSWRARKRAACRPPSRPTRGATVKAGDRTIDLTSVAVAVDLDGERLDIRELTTSRPDGELRATGSIALRGDESRVNLTAKCVVRAPALVGTDQSTERDRGTHGCDRPRHGLPVRPLDRRSRPGANRSHGATCRPARSRHAAVIERRVRFR